MPAAGRPHRRTAVHHAGVSKPLGAILTTVATSCQRCHLSVTACLPPCRRFLPGLLISGNTPPGSTSAPTTFTAPDYRPSNGPDQAPSPIKIILLPVSAVPWLHPLSANFRSHQYKTPCRRDHQRGTWPPG